MARARKSFVRNGKRIAMPMRWTEVEEDRLRKVASKHTLDTVVEKWGGKRTARAIYQKAVALGLRFKIAA